MYWRSTATLLAAALLAACGGDRREVRLPLSVWPSQYTLAVLTEKWFFTFSGNVTIEVEARQETDNITLHARGLRLGNISLHHLSDSNDTLPLPISYSQPDTDGLLVIALNSSLRPGGQYRLHIPFRGRLKIHPEGYYKISSRLGKYRTWMTGTFFQMISARDAFPCFDEPQFKARFRVSLAHHKNHTALSNMPLNHTEKYGDEEGWVIDHFDNSLVMSSYLVAYHLLQWDQRNTTTDNGRPLNVWAPSSLLQFANNTLEIAPQAITFLENYTGIPNPMPKQDLVYLPKFPGAMENWGLITLAPDALLYNPNWPSGELGQFTNSKVVIHELSHSWFGNLVTPLWWNDIWISEGAAVFFTTLVLDELRPEWEDMTVSGGIFLTQTYFSNAKNHGEPLSSPTDRVKDLESINPEKYYKGYSLFRMLYYSLGPERFQRGIRRYLSELLYGSATSELFYDAMQFNYEGMTLARLMDSWTFQQGLPVVTVNRSNDQLVLSQERFSFNHDQPTEGEETSWWIPVSFTTQSEMSFEDAQPTLWFNNETSLADPAAPSDWVLLNMQAAGTYHVRYDEQNLELLKMSLMNGSEGVSDIPTLNRFQLVLDYGLFALSGLEPLPKVLELLEFLSREQHFSPWHAGIQVLEEMRRRLAGTPAGEKLKKYALRLVAPEFSRLGMRTRNGDSVPTMEHRKQIIKFACSYELPDCVKLAEELFLKWVEQPQPDKVNPVLENRFYSFSITKHDFIKLVQGLVQYNNDVGSVLDFLEQSMDKMYSATKTKPPWNPSLLNAFAEQIVEPAHFIQLTNMSSSSKMWTKEEMASVQKSVEYNSIWRENNKNIL